MKKHSKTGKWLCLFLVMILVLSTRTAFAEQITIDNNTKTTLTTNDTITNVTTQTIKNNNAFNSFKKFNVYTGNTVNLEVPGTANNLINVVHDEHSNINGTLNSIQNGQIGGNIILVNPHGITVGNEGSINVGSLTAITPTKDFTNNFFVAPEAPNENAVNNLLNGNIPINSNATIENKGKIQAIDSVTLDSATIINSGEINCGVEPNNDTLQTDNIVNVESLKKADTVTLKKNEIHIKASNNFENTGTISSNTNTSSGSINIKTGNALKLSKDSLITTLGEKGDIILESKTIEAKGKIQANGDLTKNIGIKGDTLFLDGIISAVSTNQKGGNVNITSTTQTIETNNSIVNVSGHDGGSITHNSTCEINSAGTFSATGYNGNGGNIIITAETVILDGAQINTSGKYNGGTINVGGEYQGGKNLPIDQIANAKTIILTKETKLTADSTGTDGDGGKIILWADDKTLILSDITATPGTITGTGGFVEASSGNILNFGGTVKTSTNDRTGTLLLDPKNIVISGAGSTGILTRNDYAEYFDQNITLCNYTLGVLLSTPQNIILQASNDLTVTDPIAVDNASGDGGNLTLQAGRSIYINNDIYTDNGNLYIYANDTAANGVIDSERDAGNAEITMLADTTINAGTGTVNIEIRDGRGKTNIDSGDITLSNIYAGAIDIQNNGPTSGSDIVIDTGAILSTRNIIDKATGNHLLDPSIGNSGSISIKGNSITLNEASQILSFANYAYTPGDIQLVANDFIIDTVSAITQINAGNNIIISRFTAGDLDIASWGELTKEEIYQMKTNNLFIGNHQDTTSLTTNLEIYDDLDFVTNPGIQNLEVAATNFIYFYYTDINLLGNFHATVTNEMDFEGANITVGGDATIDTTQNAPDPFLYFYSQTLNVTGDLNISMDGNSVQPGGMWLEIDYEDFNVNGDITIDVTNHNTAEAHIYSWSGSALFNCTNLNITATNTDNGNAYIDFTNIPITTSGDINILAQTSGSGDATVSISNNTNINAEGNVNLSSQATGSGIATTKIDGNAVITSNNNINLIANATTNNAYAYIDNGVINSEGAITLTSTGITEVKSYIANSNLANITGNINLNATSGFLSGNKSYAYITNSPSLNHSSDINITSDGYYPYSYVSLSDNLTTTNLTLNAGSINSQYAEAYIDTCNNFTVSNNAYIDSYTTDGGGYTSTESYITNSLNLNIGNDLNIRATGTFVGSGDADARISNSTFNVDGNLYMFAKGDESGSAVLTEISNGIVTGNLDMIGDGDRYSWNKIDNSSNINVTGYINIESHVNEFDDCEAYISNSNVSSGSTITLYTDGYHGSYAFIRNDSTINANDNILIKANNSDPTTSNDYVMAWIDASSITTTGNLTLETTDETITASGAMHSESSIENSSTINVGGDLIISAISPSSLGETKSFISASNITVTGDIIMTATGDVSSETYITDVNSGKVINTGTAISMSSTSTANPGNTANTYILNTDFNNDTNITMNTNASSSTNSINNVIFNDNGTIQVTNDSLLIDTVQATASALNIQVDTGDITDNKGDETANIIANNVTLISTNGSIGTSLEDIDTEITGTLTATALNDIHLEELNNNLNLSNISADTILIKNTSASGNDNIIITPASLISASGANNSLVLTTTNGTFMNNAGPDALSTPFGRWLVYSDNPANTIENGVTYNKYYNKTYALNPPATISAGNSILYSIAPTLTFTAENDTREYGDANPAFTYILSGLIDGDIETDALTGSASISTPAIGTSNVGAYTIDIEQGSLALTNLGYQINTFVDGTLTITPATLNIIADNQSREYGDANPALTYIITGYKNGEDYASSDLTGAANITTTSIATDNAGIQHGVINSAAGTLNSSNYTFNYTDGDMTITPTALTIDIDDKSKIYGDANPALTATYTGFKLGQDESILAGSLLTAATNASDVGNYTITSNKTNTNYTITTNNGALAITPAALTINIDDQSKIYGDANPVLTASYTGFKLGQDESILAGNLQTTATLSSDAGNYAITSNQTNANYTITTNNSALAITPAPLTIDINDKSKIYGDANPALTATYTGFKLGQDESILAGNLQTTATLSSDAGNYAITSNQTNANYTITTNNGALAITPAPLTIDINDKSKIYGDANPALTATYTGFKLGQDESILAGNIQTTATLSSDAGNYAITSDQTNANYTITTNDGALAITPAALTINIDDKSKIYGDANPVLTASYTGFKLGQDESVLAGSLLTAATNASDVGNYTITSYQTNANYTIATNNGALAITPAALTIDIDDKSKIYGDANPPLTATYTGFKLGQDESVLAGSLLTAATNASDVGNYRITSYQTNANYTIATNNGALAITPAALTIDIDDKSKIYGDANPPLTATYTGFKLGQDESVLAGSLLTAATISSNVGNYSITSDQTNANYSITRNNGTLSINPIPAISEPELPSESAAATIATPPQVEIVEIPSIEPLIIKTVEADTAANITNNTTDLSSTMITPIIATNINQSINTSPTVASITLINGAEDLPASDNQSSIPSQDTDNNNTNETSKPVDNTYEISTIDNSSIENTELASTDESTTEASSNINNQETATGESISWSTVKNVINDNNEPINKANYQQMSAIFNVCKSSQTCSNIYTKENIILTEESIFLNSPEKEIIADLQSTKYISSLDYHPSGLKGYLRTISIIGALKEKSMRNRNITSSQEVNNDYKLTMNYRHPPTNTRLKAIQNLIDKKDLKQNSIKIIHKKDYNVKVGNEMMLSPKVKKILDIIHKYSDQKEYNDILSN